MVSWGRKPIEEVQQNANDAARSVMKASRFAGVCEIGECELTRSGGG